MISTLINRIKLRKFTNEDLLETIDLLQSKQLMDIEGALRQATAEMVIIRELKRRGLKSLDEETK
jgi:hypothetical protein